jgi:hypothetical protein
VSEPKVSKPGKRRAEKKSGSGLPGGASLDKVRSLLATAVWLAAVLCALTLAVGALVIALDFNRSNVFVDTVTQLADAIDFGEFKEFEAGKSKSSRQDALVKSVMVNWGLAALIYLVVGKVADRLIRPRS